MIKVCAKVHYKVLQIFGYRAIPDLTFGDLYSHQKYIFINLQHYRAPSNNTAMWLKGFILDFFGQKIVPLWHKSSKYSIQLRCEAKENSKHAGSPLAIVEQNGIMKHYEASKIMP